MNRKVYQPIHLFRLGALQTWQTLKVYQCSFWLSEVWVFPVAQKALVHMLEGIFPKQMFIFLNYMVLIISYIVHDVL